MDWSKIIGDDFWINFYKKWGTNQRRIIRRKKIKRIFTNEK